MSLRLQVILIFVGIVVMFYLVGQIRKRKVDIKFTLSWLLLDFVGLIFSAFPSLLDRVTSLLGILTPVNMLFFLGFLLTLIIIYTQTYVISKLSEQVRILAQRSALDEFKEQRNLEK